MKKQGGFTLVELVIVIVVTGIIAAIFAMQFGPSLQHYLAVGRRANLTHLADTALRRMVTEIRTAVPNSLRLLPMPSAKLSCLEMVPTSDGGRFRTGPDTQWDTANPATPSEPLDLRAPDAVFDVLTAFDNAPKAGDWVVIGNQNTADVYEGSDRAAIASIGSPPATGSSNKPLGQSRITLGAAKQFPYAYEGGRFNIVPDSLQAVTYMCKDAGVDAEGTGTGTLTRIAHYGFNASQACPVAGGTSAVVATKVRSCNFVYNPDQGATQQSGFAQLQLTLADHGEIVTLTVGAQVENLP
ncbi:prepilin-type N-terminal cleavage/methylation domain-containing protein [Massilia aerilata]|uniref:Prepilin-type N-terminal cleavage/methylation domain-containing protein n=1 Tax=Massilia aerilata TaxID=453817 RepID=A0ABW0RS95_9BURK